MSELENKLKVLGENDEEAKKWDEQYNQSIHEKIIDFIRSRRVYRVYFLLERHPNMYKYDSYDILCDIIEYDYRDYDNKITGNENLEHHQEKMYCLLEWMVERYNLTFKDINKLYDDAKQNGRNDEMSDIGCLLTSINRERIKKNGRKRIFDIFKTTAEEFKLLWYDY